jgi:hypothetical protein
VGKLEFFKLFIGHQWVVRLEFFDLVRVEVKGAIVLFWEPVNAAKRVFALAQVAINPDLFGALPALGGVCLLNFFFLFYFGDRFSGFFAFWIGARNFGVSKK